MEITCKPCHETMARVLEEPFGQVYRCRRCGTEISISFDRNAIEVNWSEVA